MTRADGNLDEWSAKAPVALSGRAGYADDLFMKNPLLRKTSLQEHNSEDRTSSRSGLPIRPRTAGLREYLSQKRLHLKFLAGKLVFKVRHWKPRKLVACLAEKGEDLVLRTKRSLSREILTRARANHALKTRSYYVHQLYRLSLKFHGMELGILWQYSPRPVQVTAPRISKSPRAVLPTIALVTPSYNQGHFINNTLESVLMQGYPHLRYGVVDGGSRDGTKEALAKYEHRLDYCVSEPDGGQSHAIAKGFNHLNGEIMAYLNSDDLLMPGTLRFVGELFATRSDIDVIYGHRIIIDERGREVGRWVLPRHDTQAIRHFDYVPQETLFWRRSLYNAVGGISPSFQFAMDWDLLLRFINVGARFYRVPYFLACFRVHSKQKTQMLVNTVGLDEIARLLAREHPAGYCSKRVHSLNRSYQMRSSLCATLLKCGIRY